MRFELDFLGLAQCAELVWQLRGQAGKRQVDGANVGLQHNFGIGGAAVVTMYKNMASHIIKLNYRYREEFLVTVIGLCIMISMIRI